MASLLYRILLCASILAFAYAKSAKCSRSKNVITCVNANRGVIDRLNFYYRNDVALIVEDSSVAVLERRIFQNLTFLEKLSVTESGITAVQDGAFEGLNLTHLNLARNSIRNISIGIFLDLDNLKFLDLSHNAITRFELSYLPELRYFDVSGNRLANITLIGNYSQLRTMILENNDLREFPIDSILRYPKLERVFFNGNSLNQSYETFAKFALMSLNVKIDIENDIFDDGWSGKIGNGTAPSGNDSSSRSMRSDIDKDFQLSPEVIKSLNHSQLTNLIDRILAVRNFTLMERRTIELDRKRVLDESKNVKKEYARIDQIIKRYNEVTGEAREESVGDYIEKSCERMPNDTWWRRFKKWKCKKLFNWVKRLISR